MSDPHPEWVKKVLQLRDPLLIAFHDESTNRWYFELRKPESELEIGEIRFRSFFPNGRQCVEQRWTGERWKDVEKD